MREREKKRESDRNNENIPKKTATASWLPNF
jgi:hypothetical protein